MRSARRMSREGLRGVVAVRRGSLWRRAVGDQLEHQMIMEEVGVKEAAEEEGAVLATWRRRQ